MVDSSFPRQLAPNVTGQMGLTVNGKLWVKVLRDDNDKM